MGGGVGFGAIPSWTSAPFTRPAIASAPVAVRWMSSDWNQGGLLRDAAFQSTTVSSGWRRAASRIMSFIDA